MRLSHVVTNSHEKGFIWLNVYGPNPRGMVRCVERDHMVPSLDTTEVCVTGWQHPGGE